MLRNSMLHGLTVFLLALVIVPAVVAQTEPKETAEGRVLHFLRRHRDYKPAPDADDLTILLIQRFKVVHLEVSYHLLVLGAPAIRYTSRLCDAVKRMVDAELEVVMKREDRLAILEGHVEFLKESERIKREAHLGGAESANLTHLTRAKYDRINAEIRLLKEKREPDAPKRK